MSATVDAWVGLGANLEEPVGTVTRALEALDALPAMRVRCRSSLYRTPPMGPPGQADYVNAVAGLETTLPPEALLTALLELEARLGRRRDGERWGPRVIDLDLLCYGEHRRDSDVLRLPHPGIAERAFVLVPLAELAPELRIPGLGRVGQLLSAVDTRDIEVIEQA